MTAQEAKQTIEQLTQKINHYNSKYYQESISEISDYEFDQLLAKLIQLEEEFPELRYPDSPSQRVAARLPKSLRQYTMCTPCFH